MGLALPAVVRDPNDSVARALALQGAWLGGLSLTSAGTALHHKLCHVLGGMGLPHAETHAIVLPYVTAFLAGRPRRGNPRRTRSARRDGAGALFDLRAGLGLRAGLQDIGLEQSNSLAWSNWPLPSHLHCRGNRVLPSWRHCSTSPTSALRSPRAPLSG